MRKMTKIKQKEIEFGISEILQSAIGDEYSKYILEQKDDITGNTFMENVVKNVMETSAWKNEGYYNSSDIKFAIGRELMTRLGISI